MYCSVVRVLHIFWCVFLYNYSFCIRSTKEISLFKLAVPVLSPISRSIVYENTTSALHGLLAVRGVPNTEDASGGPGQSGQCTVDVHVCV